MLVDPVSRLFDEASSEVGQGIASMMRGSKGRRNPDMLAIEAGPKTETLALENGPAQTRRLASHAVPKKEVLALENGYV